jgi:hypothetical protein
MTMRSIIAEDAQSALLIPVYGLDSRLDRLETATSMQMKVALTFLSAFSPDAFDHALDAADLEDDEPGATGEAEPTCELCGASIGIFLDAASTGCTTPATAQLLAPSTSTTQATPR